MNVNEARIPGRRLWLSRINGEPRSFDIQDRQLLVEVIRGQLSLTGTHIGCLNGDCGACTGPCRRAHHEVVPRDGGVSGRREPLRRSKACRLPTASSVICSKGCGTMTPSSAASACLGHLFCSVADLLDNEPAPDAQDVRDCLVGNICRCTGCTPTS